MKIGSCEVELNFKLSDDIKQIIDRILEDDKDSVTLSGIKFIDIDGSKWKIDNKFDYREKGEINCTIYKVINKELGCEVFVNYKEDSNPYMD